MSNKFYIISAAILLATCGTDTTGETTYTVGGTVTGLSGTVVLQNNAGDDLSLTADGSFNFATEGADESAYDVTVLTQPATQTCTVSDGSGTIDGADVTGVSVVCSEDAYTVGGTVTGLSGTVGLQNNAGDDLSLTADGSFTFTTAVADESAYAVTVLTQPDTQTCTVSDGSGTISGADITGVTVACSTDTYTVGGTVTGLSGTVVLQNNAGDNLSLTANAAFTFATAVADGAAYAVTVLTQPSLQTCTASSASGTISGANVTNVSVACASNYTGTYDSEDISGGDPDCANPADNVAFTASGSAISGTVNLNNENRTVSFTPISVTACESGIIGTGILCSSCVISGSGGTGTTVTLSSCSDGTVFGCTSLRLTKE
ncbi:MAG: hypothetical protein Q7T11_06585 [Deltaproteobacteria bacterium]|nr:hypothetical protein [Deltaproteobacteria bacterium]